MILIRIKKNYNKIIIFMTKRVGDYELGAILG